MSYINRLIVIPGDVKSDFELVAKINELVDAVNKMQGK